MTIVDGCIITCVSGLVCASLGGGIVASSGVFTGFDFPNLNKSKSITIRDSTTRILVYRNRDIIYQNEGDRYKPKKMNMETERGRRAIAEPLEELVYYSTIDFALSLNDAGIVLMHPIGDRGKIDVLWISQLFGVIGIECKRFSENNDPNKFKSAWIKKNVLSRFRITEDVYRVPITDRILVATVQFWHEDMNDVLAEEKINVVIVGSISNSLSRNVEARELFKIELDSIIMRKGSSDSEKSD